MSKVDDGELFKLDLSASNTNEENTPFTPLVVESSWTAKHPTVPKSEEPTVTQRNEKKKVEKTTSAPMGGSRIPSFRLSTPNSHGYTRVSYVNEKKADDKKQERQLSRHGHHTRKESGAVIFARPKSPLKISSTHGAKEGKKNAHFFSKQAEAATRHRRLVPEKHKIKGSPIRPLRHAKKGVSPPRLMDRPTQHHTFLTDAADVKQIEQGLLQLMEDFQAGNLRAFGKDSKLKQMEEIREQQESLARLHFSVGAEQDLYPPLSDDGLRTSSQNMRTLIEKLAHLSETIENLHTDSTIERRPSGTNNSDCAQRGSHTSVQSPPVANLEQDVGDHISPIINHGHSPPSTLHTDTQGQIPTTSVPSTPTPLIMNVGTLDDSSSPLFIRSNSQKESSSQPSHRNSKRGTCQDPSVNVVNTSSLSKRIVDT